MLTQTHPTLRALLRRAPVAAILAALCVTIHVASPIPALAAGPTAQAAVAQQTFETPEKAVDALIQANRDGDTGALLRVLGPEAGKLLHSGDPAADKKNREKFVASFEHSHSLEQRADGSMLLVVGDRKWPMPIPLVNQDGQWRFDARAGEQEILNRRIGRHELDVLEVCRAFVTAQREYALTHKLIDGTPEYARRFISHPGKQDGLYWPTAQGAPESPLGPLLAFAQAEGVPAKKQQPYHGYFYRILFAQGPAASEGAREYVANGHMTKGFALLAFPAHYGKTGIQTFLVNHNGIVRAKDLGPDTARIAARMRLYDPDATWKLP
ncbi:MAG: DUF2950 domain-containing protein [Humidesulfovibrio sp.]|nr:DUF2950 domain-containing protein [Humidesulfovibrio sp.]